MNSKSIKKYINLFGEISMSKNHSLPDDTWTKVEDSNSPNHNDALCPLFYKEDKTVNPSVYDKYGNKYTVENSFLTKNDKALFRVEENSLKRFETKITDALASYDGEYFYRAFHTENTVIVEKSTNAEDWEVDHTILLQGSTALLVERLYKNHYLAVEDRNDAVNMHVRFDSEVAQAYLSNASANKTNNQIYVTEKGDDILVCVVTESGPCVNLKNNSFYSKAFIKHADEPFKSTRTSFLVYVDVPATSRNVTGNATLSIANPTRTLSTNVCYKKEDGTYEDTEHNPITFTEGYKPRLVEGNQYLYSLYTTVFSYALTIASGQNTDPATKNVTASVDVSLTSANYPVESHTWHLDYDFGHDVSEIAETNIIKEVTITNNFGYIQSTDLIAPTTTVTIDDTSSESGHNEFEINAQNYQINVPWFSNAGSAQSIAYKVYIDSASVRAYYNSDNNKVIYLEDGYAYTPVVYWSSEAQTYNGYFFRSTWTYDVEDNDISIRPVGSPFRNLQQTYGTAIPASTASIGYHYFRNTFMRKNDNTAVSTDIAFDPDKDEVFLTYDAPSNSYYNTGATKLDGTLIDNVPKFYLPNGTRTLGKDTFVPLFNNGFVSGLSYNGTLVTPWISVDDQSPFFITNDYAFYKDVNKNKWILVKKVNEAPSIKLVENRYVVLNTTSFWNCYDSELGEKTKYSYDWNNRFVVGSDDDGHNNGNATYAGGVNVNFTINGKYSGIASATWSAYTIQNLKNDADVHFFGSRDEVPVEFYLYAGAQVPAYVKTFTEDGSFVDNQLAYWKAVYPLYNTAYMRRNPSIFADILASGNNQDYFLDGNVGYKMLYEDSEPMLLSASTGDIYGIESIFVIQSMPYAVISGKIYSLTYLNGVFQGMDCIININGMIYIGAVPSKAYFYSPNSRAIYIFTGDANLTKVKDASAITDIYYITYNPATQTIYMATNNGLYMLSDQSSYKQDFYGVQSISFLEDGTSVIVHKQNDKYTATRFYYDDAEGLTTNQVRFDTGLLGAGEHRVFTIDKYNISLFSDQKRNGKIDLVSYILQDNGQIQEEKSSIKITSSDWDKTFLSKQIDFSPKYNKGVGVGLSILSDFAITNITASATVDVATQSAGNKWSI